MHRTALVGAIVAGLAASAHADLTLIVDTDAQTLAFDGSLTADPPPAGANFIMRWDLTLADGMNNQSAVVDAIDLLASLMLGQDYPQSTPSNRTLRSFPSGAGDDLLRIEFLWPAGDPGNVTLTPTGVPQSYATLHPTARDLIERSVGSTFQSAGPFAGGAPGIPVVPAPGALALLPIAGAVVSRRRR
ncbi:MAG: hypothetical protein Tsb0013_16640 [Phycisphaerales bacterium]